jgi:transposase-like protein
MHNEFACREQFPAIAVMGLQAMEEVTAFADVPHSYGRKIWAPNPTERLSREVKRPNDVVGIFPNPDALPGLPACVLIETHDE